MNVRNRTVVILDNGQAWKGHECKIVYWAEFDVPSGCISVPLLVEKQAEALRKEYLAWVHEIGDLQLQGKTLREHLKVDDTFSFWWMTLLAEKSPLKSKSIYTIFKLRAFEKLYLSSDSNEIILCSNNKKLHLVFSQWCQKLDHRYQWRRVENINRKISSIKIYHIIPTFLKAFVYLLYILWTRKRHLSKRRKSTLDAQHSIVTYFPNINTKKAHSGVFYSNYWNDLHRVFEEQQVKINWLLIYEKNHEFTFQEAVDFCNRLNMQDKNHNYAFIEEFLDTNSIVNALIVYFKIAIRKFRLREIENYFHFPNSQLNFWPVSAAEWRSSLYGPNAINSVLMLSIFVTLVKNMPFQKWGLYLYENQPWEKALIRSWRNKRHGKLIGVQHTSLRFLYLNCLEDSETYKLKTFVLPLPDLIAVNGALAENILKQVEFPANRVAKVEALRFMYLAGFLRKEKNLNKNQSKPNILVLTGYARSEVYGQLQLLAEAVKEGALEGHEILIKPHPFSPVDEIVQNIYFDTKYSITNKPLSSLLGKATLVYTGNLTAASLEAAVMGIKVLVFVGEDNLNMSPLYGFAEIPSVRTVTELCEAIKSTNNTEPIDNIFHLDEELPRWCKLLNLMNYPTAELRGIKGV